MMDFRNPLLKVLRFSRSSEGAEAWLDHYLRGLMALPEGWGTSRTEYLTRILERLVALPALKIVPAREILAFAKQLSLFVLYD
jgi:hypothetical protein